MKKITLYILALASMIFTSCEDMLEIKPESSLVYGSYWESEDAARAAQVALHANLRSYYPNLWYMGEIRSDIWGGSTIESANDLDVIEQNISTDFVPSFSTNWAGLYAYLHLVNGIIENLPSVTFTVPAGRDYFLAQAYGIRAFIYYNMLRTWGDVPIVLEPTTVIDFENMYIARSPQEDVMAQIKDDIETSLDLFGTGNSFQVSGSKGRNYWSKAATLTLKGDVYIWSGTNMGGGDADYTAAKNALQAVIDQSATFGLLASYADVFSATNKGNKEIIFSLSYAMDQATNMFSNFTARKNDISLLYDRLGGTTASVYVNGANRYGPTDALLARWSDFTDTRNDATFYRMYANNDATGYRASMLKKFFGTVQTGTQYMIDDIPIYRFADVLLLMAEAKNRLSEDPSAEITLIRKRAYGANYAGHEFTSGTPEENAVAILDERLFEFIGEGKRWWDLRRAGNEYVFMFNEYLDPATDTYKLLLPITRDMITRNPLLDQTTGYAD